MNNRSADEVTVMDVALAIESRAHTILDVREQDEWDAGHIAEAVHIPLGDLAARIGELPQETPVYTVCHAGVRSLMAVDILSAGGVFGAKSLAGGMVAWAGEGKPYV